MFENLHWSKENKIIVGCIVYRLESETRFLWYNKFVSKPVPLCSEKKSIILRLGCIVDRRICSSINLMPKIYKRELLLNAFKFRWQISAIYEQEWTSRRVVYARDRCCVYTTVTWLMTSIYVSGLVIHRGWCLVCSAVN